MDMPRGNYFHIKRYSALIKKNTNNVITNYEPMVESCELRQQGGG